MRRVAQAIKQYYVFLSFFIHQNKPCKRGVTSKVYGVTDTENGVEWIEKMIVRVIGKKDTMNTARSYPSFCTLDKCKLSIFFLLAHIRSGAALLQEK
jgi:hypothetical protein